MRRTAATRDVVVGIRQRWKQCAQVRCSAGWRARVRQQLQVELGLRVSLGARRAASLQSWSGLAVAISFAQQRRCRSRFVQWSRVYFEQELCAVSALVSYFKETGSYCAKSLRRGAFCVTKFGQVVYAALAWATLSRRTSHQRRWEHVRLQSGALRLVCLCTRAWHLLVLQLWPATYTLRKRSLLSSSGETLFCGTSRRNRRSLPSFHDACREAFMRRRLTFWWSVLLDCVELAFWRDGIPGAPERLLAGTSSLF